MLFNPLAHASHFARTTTDNWHQKLGTKKSQPEGWR
jgi:hypothetical protein